MAKNGGHFTVTFNIGDKVVYPMHGAGIIEAIEEKEVLGEKQTYYIMKLPIGDMKVMIPTDNVAEIGLRQSHRQRGRRESLSDLAGRKVEHVAKLESPLPRQHGKDQERRHLRGGGGRPQSRRSAIGKRGCQQASARCWITPGRFSSASWSWHKMRLKRKWRTTLNQLLG